MNGVTLRQLEYFLAVVDHESITRGAAACHVSPAGLSAALNELEKNLGLQLMLRQRAKGAQITSAGRHVAERARDLLRQAHELSQAAETLQGRLSGSLRVGCHITLSPWLVPPILDHFAREHPAVEIDVTEGSPIDLQQLLIAGQLDAALLLSNHVRTERITSLKLMDVRPRLALSTDHRLADRGVVSFRELEREPCVLPALNPASDLVENMIRSAGIAPRVRWRITNVETIRSIVARNLAYSILIGRPCGNTSYDGGELTYAEIADPVPPNSIVLAQPDGVRTTAKMDALLDFCERGELRL